MPYITPRGLKGLEQYQYKSAGYTWLDDLHTPFWNGVVERLPLWLAPNLITLVGTAGLIASYFLYGFYLPDLQGAAPWWVFFLGGFSVLFYLHLDCIDGKQARRTKSSSPLGQLFDHGCDALSVHLIVTNLAAALGMSLGWRATLFSVGVMGPWALAHWEEYHSGVMNYGTGYWGVLEANYLVVAGHWVTMLLGHQVWSGEYSSILGWQLPWGVTLRRGDLNLLLVLGGGTQQILGQIWHTMAIKRIRVPVKERGHKQLGRRNALQHLLQIQLVLVLGAISTLEPTSSVWHACATGHLWHHLCIRDVKADHEPHGEGALCDQCVAPAVPGCHSHQCQAGATACAAPGLTSVCCDAGGLSPLRCVFCQRDLCIFEHQMLDDSCAA
jgi:ethanolaminephosphotransferase